MARPTHSRVLDTSNSLHDSALLEGRLLLDWLPQQSKSVEQNLQGPE